MPKIVPTLSPAAPNLRAAAGADSQTLTSRSAPRKDGAGGAFDQILTGARQREIAAPPSDTNEPKPDSAAKAKPAKDKPRAERREPAAKAGKADPRKDAPHADAADESPDAAVDQRENAEGGAKRVE